MFEEKCQQIIQMIDALIASCRQELKKEDLTVKSLLAAQKRLRDLTANELVKILEQRHKNHYATIINLINFASRDIDSKVAELKEIENHLVASVMEQLDSIENSKDKKDDVLAKLAQFKGMLDKYSGSNPEWCKIGLNRIEQLEKDLSKPSIPEPKKLDVEDFMMYSDEEIEEEFDEDMAEEETD